MLVSAPLSAAPADLQARERSRLPARSNGVMLMEISISNSAGLGYIVRTPRESGTTSRHARPAMPRVLVQVRTI